MKTRVTYQRTKCYGRAYGFRIAVNGKELETLPDRESDAVRAAERAARVLALAGVEAEVVRVDQK